MTREYPTVIYTCSYGFRDNEALGKIWGRTEKYALARVRKAVSEAARMYESEYESQRTLRDQIWYVGPFAEQVEDVIADMEDPSREAEFRDDLGTLVSGHVY